MAVQIPALTNEEFWEFEQRPENKARWFELWNGAIVEMPSASPLHGWIAARILHFIMTFLDKHDRGFAVGDSNDFALAPGYVFKPDAAFISKTRLPKLPNRFEIAPDLVVEIVSPSNTSPEILEKVESYIRFGTKLVWVVYPEERVVRVYAPAQGGAITLRKVTLDGVLDGEDVLPGFSLPVRAIFPEVTSDTGR